LIGFIQLLLLINVVETDIGYKTDL